MDVRIVAVGTSLGGFQALRTVLGALTKDFRVPIAVVQHRSHNDSELFASLLATELQLPLIEVEDKQPISDGHVYICPANYHLLIDDDHFALSADEPVIYARPSIDVLFESAAESFGQSAVGVLLTGMSRDGSAGLRKIKQCGGFTVVQDPATAEGPAMPEAAIASVTVDKILPLEEIAPFLMELCARQRSQV
jgi:two-component system, chemotaxis family, protein-glutamate methylesterase/glutaminase